MSNKIIDKINSLNQSIIEAKQRYINKEKIDGALEFPFEIDLLRYTELCEYEKVEAIKEYLDNNNNIDINFFDESDNEIFKKIFCFMKILPKEKHKCIGCPCLENDYPKCEKCSFQSSCLFGNTPYPNECSESDCFKTFDYLKNISQTR